MKLNAYKFLFAFLLTCLPLALDAAEPIASDGVAVDEFGRSVSISGGVGLVGAARDDDAGQQSGSAYLFRGLGSAAGNPGQDVKLRASDAAAEDRFGWAVSISGTSAISGAIFENGGFSGIGSAYLFRGLDVAGSTATQVAKLTPSDGTATDNFGWAAGIDGTIALVGSINDDDDGANSGSVYLFRGLDMATGTITETAKLKSSDAAANDNFGISISLSGTAGLVGAPNNDGTNGIDSGSAYLFRSLDTVGAVSETAKLTASDGAADDSFGESVSLSGAMGLVGAHFDDDRGANSGSAYLFRNLDTATGGVTQVAKLNASDGSGSDFFGWAVGVSGATAIIGAYGDDDRGSLAGSAYLFRGLDMATGSVTESVKISASDGVASDNFGFSVAIDGDDFIIGALSGDGAVANSGSAYSGSFSSLTVMDTGNTSRTISKISFTSREDWVVGNTTDGNEVTLSSGDSADVRASGKAVFVGKEAGSDGNRLDIAGTLLAGSVAIGAETGTAGNALVLRSSANFTGVTGIIIGEGNKLIIEGDHTAAGALLTKLGATALQAWDGAALQTVTNGNQDTLLTASFSGGFTTFSTPSTGYAAWAETNAPTGDADEDFDGDGVDNAVEYVLGGTKDSNDLGKLPEVSESGDNFIFTFQRDQATTDATVRIEVGTTLATWPDSYAVLANTETQEAGVAVEDNPANPGFDTVTLTIAKAPDTRKFARLNVTPGE